MAKVKIKTRRKIGGVINADCEWFAYDNPKQEAAAAEHGREVLKGEMMIGRLLRGEAFGEPRMTVSPRLKLVGEDLDVDHKGVTMLPNHTSLTNALNDVDDGTIVVVSADGMYDITKGPYAGKQGYGYAVEVIELDGEDGEDLPF